MNRPFKLAINEIENILTGYERPETELFSRYLNKKGQDQEAFVLALIGAAMTKRKREEHQWRK